MSAQLVRSRRPSLVVAAVVAAVVSTSCPAGGVVPSEPRPDPGVVHTLTRHSAGDGRTSTVVDGRGRTTVVWAEHWWRGPIRAVRRPAGGEWGRAVTIARGGTAPIAAVDARGNVTVVFQTNRRDRTTGVSAVRRLVKGGWQHPVHLSKDADASGYGPNGDEGTFGAHRVDLAVNLRGDAVVVWQWGSEDRNRPFRIQSVYRPAGHAWRGLARLTGPDWSQEPLVAIGPGGGATAVYGGVSRRRVVGEGWRGPVRTGATSSGADLVVDGRGTATLTFSDYRGDVNRVMATRRPLGAVAWRTPRRISPQRVDIGGFSQVQHPSGAISVAMQRYSGRIDVARRPQGGPWRDPVLVSRAGRSANPPVVATDATDFLFVLWQNQKLGLRGRLRYPAGGWTPIFQVSPSAGYFAGYEAAAYPDGDTLAVWERGSSSGSIKARRMFK